MRNILFAFLLVCCHWFSAYSQSIFPEKPDNYITDDAGILSYSQSEALNSKLKNLEDSSSNQVFVYITNSLQGNDLFSISQNIFNTWKIGQEGKDNGVLITVFISDKQFRIHTGYGLESVLPDLTTKSIQDEYMGPQFKEGKYYEGIDVGIDKIIEATKGAYVSGGSHKIKAYTDGELITSHIFMVIFMLGCVLEIILMNKKYPKFRKKLFVLYGTTYIIYVFSMQLLCPNLYYPILFTGFIFIAAAFLLYLPMLSFIQSNDDNPRAQKVYYWVVSIFSGAGIAGVFLYVYGDHLESDYGFMEIQFAGMLFTMISFITSIFCFFIVGSWSGRISMSGGSSSYSSSGSSYSSSSSSSSGFSGGGGGRSGGGGSSSSW
ncbi:MAG: TPM domain-containing protein [Bacteroidota bacterium]|nr:TPM domain-containing protein [Bacteroidota bacterium]